MLILYFQTCQKIYQSDIKSKYFKLVSWFYFLLAWNLVSLRYNSDPGLSRQIFDKYILAIDDYFLFPANLMIQIPFFVLFPLFSKLKWIKTGDNLIGIVAFWFLCIKSSYFGWRNTEFLCLCPLFSSVSIKADTMLIRQEGHRKCNLYGP